MTVQKLNRKNFIYYTGIEESQLRGGSESFAIHFETFGDLTRFFTGLGQTGAYNEVANSTTNREIYDSVATGLADVASLDAHWPGGFEVSFPGWVLT